MIFTETLIGKVVHFYNKISVAVLSLNAELRVGETIRFSGKNTDFTQTVESLQIAHQPLEAAAAGTDAGLKTNQPVHEGDAVYKVS